jgi:hypothetical protein
LSDFYSYLRHIKEVMKEYNYKMSKDADAEACARVFLFNEAGKFITTHSDTSFSVMVVSKIRNEIICVDYITVDRNVCWKIVDASSSTSEVP